MAALGYEWRDVEAALGLPLGSTVVAAIPARERLRLLSREFEPLDVASIERIARGELRGDDRQLDIPASGGADLVDDLATMMAADQASGNLRATFLRAIAKRIDDFES